MKSRLVKKIKTRDIERRKEDVELILSKHWQRHLNEDEAKNSILLALSDVDKPEGLPAAPSGRADSKLNAVIDKVLQKNRESNHRHMTRIKLFPINALIDDLFSGFEAAPEGARAGK